jgi:hemerythrin-like domain-containing protein
MTLEGVLEKAIPSADRRPLVQKLGTYHDELLSLCDLLESIADSLPKTLDYRKCHTAAQLLLPLISSVYYFEEQEVLPRLAGKSPAPKQLKMIERLKAEHFEDLCYAEELSETLNTIASVQNPASGESLGYMLRGFFELIRRRIAFEREQIVPKLH